MIQSEEISEDLVHAITIEDYARLLGDVGKVFHFQATVCKLQYGYTLPVRFKTRAPAQQALRLAIGSRLIALPLDLTPDGDARAEEGLKERAAANNDKSFEATIKIIFRANGDRMLPHIMGIFAPMGRKEAGLHYCSFTVDFGFHELRCSYHGCTRTLHKRDIPRDWIPKTSSGEDKNG